MHIDVQALNTRLPRAHALSIAQRLRETFGRMAHAIAKIVVRVSEVPGAGLSARECVVEVHFPDGRVTTVNERQRKLGSLLRRATERSWRAVTTLHASSAAPQHVRRPRAVQLSCLDPNRG